MDIYDHVEFIIGIIVKVDDQLADGMHGGLAKGIGLGPAAVEVLSQEVAHGVAQEDAVRVHDVHQFKDEKSAKFFGHGVAGD